jgi:hypothetical protein
MAKDWLAATAQAGDGFCNRPIDRVRVTEFRRLLRGDRFDLLNDEVAISPEGWIINGQHRLTAVLEESIGAWFAVRYNLPKDTFGRIDTGKVRNGATALRLAGHKSESALTALARLAWSWQHGKVTFPRVLSNNDDLIAYVDEHPEFDGSTEGDPVPYGAKWAKHLPGVPQRFISLFAWTLLGDTSGFLSALVEDDGPDADEAPNPATFLRKTYLWRSEHGEDRDFRKTVGLFIKGRNLWPDGPLPRGNRLKIADSEAFPRPQWSPPVPLGLDEDEEE